MKLIYFIVSEAALLSVVCLSTKKKKSASVPLSERKTEPEQVVQDQNPQAPQDNSILSFIFLDESRVRKTILTGPPIFQEAIEDISMEEFKKLVLAPGIKDISIRFVNVSQQFKESIFTFLNTNKIVFQVSQ